MLELTIPESARPHEVGIIRTYWEFRSVTKVAEVLHYKDSSPVRRVIGKYRVFLSTPDGAWDEDCDG